MKEQLVKLLQSGILLRFDRTLEETLQRITETARFVIGAKYAALAVLDEQRRIARFFYSGLSKEEAERIGQLPQGRGMLGVLIEEGKPLRLRDVTKHPKAYGFPPHHPVMRSFLGVPIFVNGKPFGRLRCLLYRRLRTLLVGETGGATRPDAPSGALVWGCG